jgi:hypothetical protein
VMLSVASLNTSSRMLKKSASAKTVSREASLVKRISKRPSFVKREAYLASRKINACERRDTRDERRTKRTAFLSILLTNQAL